VMIVGIYYRSSLSILVPKCIKSTVFSPLWEHHSISIFSSEPETWLELLKSVHEQVMCLLEHGYVH